MSYYDEASNVVDIPKLVDVSGKAASFWRKEVPVVDKSGVTKGGMWPKQREWWELQNFIKLFVGGYGAGKTNIISKRMISLALANAPAPVACISPTFPMARETTILTISDLLQGKRAIYGKRFFWKYNSSTHEFIIKHNGRTARIIIYSGDNPTRLKGPNLAAAGIDEPFIQDIEVFKQIIARIRHPDAVIKELCLTGTPEQLNWGYDLCYGDLKEDHDVALVNVSTRENKALDPDYVKNLEAALSDKEAEAYVDGKFMNLAIGQVYHAFDSRYNVAALGMPEYAHIGAGMDFNVCPMSATVFWVHKGHMHIFDEFELPDADTEILCQELREKYGQKLTTIYPDATGNRRQSSSGGKSDFHIIREFGFEIDAPGRNPDRRDRYNAVNGKFKARNGKSSLTIDPRCKKLIKYLNLYSHSTLKQQEDMSHLLDAATYPVHRLFPINREKLTIKTVKGF